jgi:hypothetical protein
MINQPISAAGAGHLPQHFELNKNDDLPPKDAMDRLCAFQRIGPAEEAAWAYVS